ncbi:MAG: hypothetical protein ACKVIH_13355 [Burkholderiales bacterium]
MNETDLYFTHTIVGAPQTVMLGMRVTLPKVSVHGVEVNMSQGHARISQAWQDWLMLHQDDTAPGTPRARPGPTRRWLQRYSLALALLGLASTAAAAGFMAWQLWLKIHWG